MAVLACPVDMGFSHDYDNDRSNKTSLLVTNESMRLDLNRSHERLRVFDRFSTGISESDYLIFAMEKWGVDAGALYLQVRRLGIERVEDEFKFVNERKNVHSRGAYFLACLKKLTC